MEIIFIIIIYEIIKNSKDISPSSFDHASLIRQIDLMMSVKNDTKTNKDWVGYWLKPSSLFEPSMSTKLTHFNKHFFLFVTNGLA